MAFLKKIPPEKMSDAELVNAYRQSGSMNVLGNLYQRYMELVYGVCLKYLQKPADAQDAVIAIFEELVAKLQKHEVDNFKPWLHTVAKNHCLMKLRSQKRQPTVSFDMELVQSEENVHLDGELDKEENLIKLDYCLGQLQEEQRKAIDLFYLQGKCYNEIAAVMGLEWNKVRSYIQNGRRNLKICMDSAQTNAIIENGAVRK